LDPEIESQERDIEIRQGGSKYWPRSSGDTYSGSRTRIFIESLEILSNILRQTLTFGVAEPCRSLVPLSLLSLSGGEIQGSVVRVTEISLIVLSESRDTLYKFIYPG